MARLFLVYLVLSVAIARGQTDPAQPTPEPTIAQVQSALDAAQADTQLDEATRASVVDLYQNALAELRRAGEQAAQALEYRNQAQAAPGQLATIRAELATPPAKADLQPPVDPTVKQLDGLLDQANAELAAARQLVVDLQAESARRSERRVKLPELIAQARQQLTDAEARAPPAPAEGEPPQLTQARELLRRAQLATLRRNAEALEAELASYEARTDLLPARRDQAQRRVSEKEALVAAWQSLVARQRQVEAARAAREAERLGVEAARQHPVLKRFADETAELAVSLTGDQSVTAKIDEARRTTTQLNTLIDTVGEQFSSIRRRLDVSGLNRATGLMLRRQLETLPDPTKLRRQLRETQRALEDDEYALVELQDERLGAGDIDRVARALVSQIPDTATPADRADLESVARELASARRDLLDRLIASRTTLFDSLAELHAAQDTLINESTVFRSFIDERILWVRTMPGDQPPRWSEIRQGIAWLTDATSWQQAVTATMAEARNRWFRISMVGLAIVLAWVVRHSALRRLGVIGERVMRFRTDAFGYTLQAVGLTAAVAAPPVATLWALGWLLVVTTDQPAMVSALGHGMIGVVLVWSPLEILRKILVPRGLAESHFRWPEPVVRPIRRNLRWFVPVVVPLLILVDAMEIGASEPANASLGRLLLTGQLVALSIFLHRVFRPKGAVLRAFLESNKTGWLSRTRVLWHPALAAAPLAFAVMSWMGFHEAAIRLERQLEKSLVLALVLVVVNGVLLRWLYVARRRVAIESARRRREQATAESEARASSGDARAESPPAVDEDKLDLPALSDKTRQLINAAVALAVLVGLLWIWSSVLPALRMLDRVQVWPSVRVVESDNASRAVGTPSHAAEPVASEAGRTGITQPMTPGLISGSQTSDTAAEPIAAHAYSLTIADLGWALIVLAGTWVAFRNLPGLVEIIFLQRLPLDAGSRYALSTVFRYLIAIVGVVVAFNALGLSWTRVQWLAAALTFGLAFGLQEIFANFVSGLIILAERPIRLGDTVTVGQTTGTVTRIRMRATTILDWDRKELVIPNKTFITSDVINWTLSDPVLRLIIPVGVSYSSDVKRVESLLHAVAAEHPLVLDDPPTKVLFKDFGDSTLDFELRVFIPHIEYYFKINHELHMMIIERFRKAGVEIAFPQRDLHLRSAEALEGLLTRGTPPPGSGRGSIQDEGST